MSLVGLGLCGAAPVFAEDENLVFTNKNGWTTTLYGQLNMTYQGVDDGTETYNEFVNNTNSTTRVGLWIDSPTGDNRLRFNFETALGIRATAETNQIANPSYFDWQRTDIRKLELTYSGNFGAIWAGQGSMAADGIAEFDKSGTSVAGYSALADTAGAYLFRLSNVLSTVPVGSVFRNFDAGRRMRIRYDTPEFSGFKVSASYGQDVLATAVDATTMILQRDTATKQTISRSVPALRIAGFNRKMDWMKSTCSDRPRCFTSPRGSI